MAKLVWFLAVFCIAGKVRGDCVAGQQGDEMLVCTCTEIQDGEDADCNDVENDYYDMIILRNSPDLTNMGESFFGPRARGRVYNINFTHSDFRLGRQVFGVDNLDEISEIHFVGTTSASSKLEDVDPEAFLGIPNLQVFSLTNSRTTNSLSTALMPFAASIETLTLYDNRMDNFTTTVVFPRLRELDLSHNDLTVFDATPNVRTAMPALVSLGLSENNLVEVPPGLSNNVASGGSDLVSLDLSVNFITTLRSNDLRNLRFASEINLKNNRISYFESASLYLDGYWDIVRQPLRIDLSGNIEDANFAVDAFGEMDRAFIAELDMTSSHQTTLPREPFFELLRTSYERTDLPGITLSLLTNSTAADIECCSVDWLFVEGRKWGNRYQAQVPEISCVFTEESAYLGEDGGEATPEGGVLWDEDGPTCDDFSKMCVAGGLEEREEWKEDCLDAIYYSSSSDGDGGGDGGSSSGAPIPVIGDPRCAIIGTVVAALVINHGIRMPAK